MENRVESNRAQGLPCAGKMTDKLRTKIFVTCMETALVRLQTRWKSSCNVCDQEPHCYSHPKFWWAMKIVHGAIFYCLRVVLLRIHLLVYLFSWHLQISLLVGDHYDNWQLNFLLSLILAVIGGRLKQYQSSNCLDPIFPLTNQIGTLERLAQERDYLDIIIC